jgi:hypothetical protein
LKQQQQSTDAKMNQTIQQMAVTNQKMDETVNHVKTMETTVTSKYDELRKQNKDMEDKLLAAIAAQNSPPRKKQT